MSVFDELRKDYQMRGLDRQDLAGSPLEQFDRWMEEAIEKSPGPWLEPNAMTLSTADCRGNVTARTVLLKHFDDNGFVFFTNYQSEKARQLEENPNAALLFHWSYLGRQVRINGSVVKTSRDVSESYFQSRPRGAQISAWASAQSRRVKDRQTLERAASEMAQRFAGMTVPLPEQWGGYLLRPEVFEFWQGRIDRLHDRLQYTRSSGEKWIIQRLAP